MIKIKNTSVIYILAPGGIASGGPEALHQLHYYFNKLGYTSKMAYYSNPITNPRYHIYKPEVILLEDIVDDEENLIIVPEINTKYLKKIKKCRKCIWWLGVQYFDGFETMPQTLRDKLKIKMRFSVPQNILKLRQQYLKHNNPSKYSTQPYLIENTDFNLCGSKFAFDFIRNKFKNVRLLVEPLGLKFLSDKTLSLNANIRSDVVLYNPSKSSKILDELLKRTDISFKAISGYNENELVELFRSSKLYIDFGMFGGPERLPKETVLNGTMLLVGKRNASINNFDIAIPDKYKLPMDSDLEFIAEKIKFMLSNYSTLIEDFTKFRNQIVSLEPKFKESIQEIFTIT
ncbi:hypothetical protein [Sphingobacterium sp.]|uniref:hypothetical protein n=1 Tax=Sphingobacterium sp. TaxID=341027 RepID=UPI0028B026FD|nr:hypothetical protein [Sphingobacterium sp.]